MSQRDYDRALERMATEPAFAGAVRADPAAALDGYDLTDAERQGILALRSESPAATAGAAPRALEARRSKSSMLGIGALSAAAIVGAGGYGYVHYLTYSRSLSVDSGARQTISTVSLDNAGDIASASAPAAGTTANSRLAITKPVDSMSPQLHQAAVSGSVMDTITVAVKRGGSDWLTYQGSRCLVASESVGAISSSASSSVENVTFQCQSVNVTYP